MSTQTRSMDAAQDAPGRRLSDAELAWGDRWVDPAEPCRTCGTETDVLGCCVGPCAGEEWEV